MLVRATQRGFYKSLRAVDEVFDVPESLYSATWMTKVPVIAGKPVVSLNVPAVGGVQPTAKPSLNIPSKPILGLPNKPAPNPPSPSTPLAPRPRFPLFGEESPPVGAVPPEPSKSFFGPGVKTP